MAVSEENNYIYTLGKFLIRQGDQVISENTNRSKRMWEIFKFILSYRDKVFFPESILESIWPERDYSDPATIMRAHMFRLRQALKIEEKDRSLAANLVLTQGCYHWENRVSCWIDSDEFESLAGKADDLATKQPEEAINLYKKAIDLYKGEYLPESSFSEWIIPLRTYYHDIFLECVFSLSVLLKSKHAYKEIIKLCEQALKIDYYEEKIHIKLMEALVEEGLNARARAHYNEATLAFYRELGVKPSDEMKKLYRMVGLETGSYELDLATIQEGLKGKEVVSGAYFCDTELFRYFYNLERMRSERSGKSVFLSLLTLVRPDYSSPRQEELKAAMQYLQETIKDSLRKGDIVTRWNEAQFLLLLPGLNREQAANVLDRIEKKYSDRYTLKEMILKKKVESLLPLEDDVHFY